MSDLYDVPLFRPDSPNVTIGRGVDTVDTHADAVQIANALLEAGLVQLADHVVIHNPIDLHHRLFSDPPLVTAAELRPGDNYEIIAVDSPALPLPPAPEPKPANALFPMVEEWLRFNRELPPLVGLAAWSSLSEIVGKVRMLKADRDNKADALSAAGEEITDLKAQLDDALAVICQQAATIDTLKQNAKVEALSTLIAELQRGPRIELLTLDEDVNTEKAQEDLDRKVAAKIAEGWRVDYRTINTVVVDFLPSHHEFVKLARPVIAPAADDVPAATAEAVAPADSTPTASVPLPDSKRLIVEAVPVATVPLNRFDMFPGKTVEEAIEELLSEDDLDPSRNTLSITDIAIMTGKPGF